MTPEVYKIWTSIDGVTVSSDGNYVAYVLTREIGDPILKIYNLLSGQTKTINRGSNPRFDHSNNFLTFHLSPSYDSVRQKKLQGIKKEKLPGDTLGIYNLKNASLDKISNLNSFHVPEKWGHHVAILIENKDEKDKKEGSTLFFKNLMNNHTDTFPGVKDMAFPEEKEGLVIYSNGQDSTVSKGLYYYDFVQSEFKTYFEVDGEFHQLSFSDDGSQFSFIGDLDTSNIEKRPYTLYHSNFPTTPQVIVAEADNQIPDGMQISTFRKPSWSDDMSTMYFGVSPIPFPEDTTILDEEKPKVEVWTTKDPVLYTMQEVRKKVDEKKNYLMAINDILSGNRAIVQLEKEDIDEVRLPRYGNSKNLLAIGDINYQKSVTWLGHDFNDLFIIDAKTGNRMAENKKINGNISLSPNGKFAYWFDRDEQQYNTLNLTTTETIQSSKGINTSLGNELNDVPQAASNYGIAGWTKNDENLLIYDRYDIWKIDPQGKVDPVNLTNGRTNQLVSRYIELDRDADFIDLRKKLLLSIFDEKTKFSGYAYLNPDLTIDQKILEPFSYGRRVVKAKNASVLVYTKESMALFPDLVWSSTALDNQTKISNANPQQSEYLWGSAELYAWKDAYGNEMSGMLYTPENFDPSKKYPLIINFYERSSDGLYRHRAPFAGRSTISYSYYLSQGYVIFNPDIPYQIGYPGKSALNAVMSGLDALIAEGYIDEKHVGIQGHSWGGYQIAHILTKTNRFTCAEAGAPVVNMTSAYGGIRWGSGMSRMFQYEKTQSRLGNTLWERPDLYLENSPLFETDKVETPVLILHNDNDGAVPWYQGIEYYMALRRLDKTGWLLNYNGEPHWPVKWPNRLDFQTRMEQFFAHYLLDKPMPEWMKNGVSELEKGKMLGY